MAGKHRSDNRHNGRVHSHERDVYARIKNKRQSRNRSSCEPEAQGRKCFRGQRRRGRKGVAEEACLHLSKRVFAWTYRPLWCPTEIVASADAWVRGTGDIAAAASVSCTCIIHRHSCGRHQDAMAIRREELVSSSRVSLVRLEPRYSRCCTMPGAAPQRTLSVPHAFRGRLSLASLSGACASAHHLRILPLNTCIQSIQTTSFSCVVLSVALKSSATRLKPSFSPCH